MERLTVDEERCVGCGQCTLVCEAGALRTEWGSTVVAEDRCALCAACVDLCPVGALTMGEDP